MKRVEAVSKRLIRVIEITMANTGILGPIKLKTTAKGIERAVVTRQAVISFLMIRGEYYKFRDNNAENSAHHPEHAE